MSPHYEDDYDRKIHDAEPSLFSKYRRDKAAKQSEVTEISDKSTVLLTDQKSIGGGGSRKRQQTKDESSYDVTDRTRKTNAEGSPKRRQ